MRRTHRRVKTPVRNARGRGAKRPVRVAAPATRRKSARSSHDAALFLAFQNLVGEIFRFNGCLLDVAGAMAGDLQITPTQWQIIAVIRSRPLTIPAISRRVGLRRQSVQHNIKQLATAGLVEQATNPDHRRASLIRLAPAGQTLMPTLTALQIEIAHVFTDGLGLSARDLDSIRTWLVRMREQPAVAATLSRASGR